MADESRIEGAAEGGESYIEEAAARAADLVRELLTKIERAYPDKEGFEVGTLAVVAEVDRGVHFQCSDRRRWIQSGLFRAAMQIADQLRGEAITLSGEAPKTPWFRKIR